MKLDFIRIKIDSIDDKILELLATRKKLVQNLAAIKNENNISIEDRTREMKILQRLQIKARELNLSFGLVKNIFNQVFEDSKNIQTKK